MIVLDTQIVSYAYKNIADFDITNLKISCLTAKEFLTIQNGKTDKPYYCVPNLPKHNNLKSYLWRIGQLKREHPFSERSTDFTLLDFGKDFPPLREYCNLAVSNLVNTSDRELFRESIRFLAKAKRKSLMKRFEFLIDKSLNCLYLSKNAIDLGFDLIYEFDKKYSLKTDIRNSVYDILILATAIENNAVFITKDSVLNRFAAEYLGINISKRSDYIEIPFVNLSEKQEKKNRESKEYINRGWQVRIRNTQGFF